MVENLINDLLDLAKLKNNKFNLSEDYFDLTYSIYQAFEMMSYVAQE
jgi:signal transduction histidine kinase|tara:strand:- start:1201 stop:1341 length:141 start_codon:yes stop_codon:yes gene_type:complete